MKNVVKEALISKLEDLKNISVSGNLDTSL